MVKGIFLQAFPPAGLGLQPAGISGLIVVSRMVVKTDDTHLELSFHCLGYSGMPDGTETSAELNHQHPFFGQFLCFTSDEHARLSFARFAAPRSGLSPL
mgnify:CR=1 FL=1